MPNSNELDMSEPIINTFNIYGSITSILKEETCRDWLYNNFIQIRYVYDWDTFFFDYHHLLMDNCPWLDHHCIPRHFLQSKWNSLSSFITESIDQGHYVYFYTDHYYISASGSYGKEHRWHEMFIYGYDRNRQVYLVADNFLNGKYVHAECPFDEVEKGYRSIQSDNQFFLNMHLFSKKEEEAYIIDLPQIVRSIEHYMYSTPSLDVSFKEKTAFGIEAVKLITQKGPFLSLTEPVFQTEKDLDRRAFHLFWEHKKLMLDRFKYLEDKFQFEFSEEIIREYEGIVFDYKVLRNMALKFNLKKDRNLLIRIRNFIGVLIEREICILGAAVDCIPKSSKA